MMPLVLVIYAIGIWWLVIDSEEGYMYGKVKVDNPNPNPDLILIYFRHRRIGVYLLLLGHHVGQRDSVPVLGHLVHRHLVRFKIGVGVGVGLKVGVEVRVRIRGYGWS
jgi:hypothetical protein